MAPPKGFKPWNTGQKFTTPEKARAAVKRANKKFGKTPEQYTLEILEGCGICGRLPMEGEVFCYDHDHRHCPTKYPTCGGKCVRKLLCHSCNRGIGFLHDGVEILNRAISYLKVHNGTA